MTKDGHSGPGSLRVRAGGASQPGLRKAQNQDAFFWPEPEQVRPERGHLFVISDGVSTVRLGQWSAQLTCKRLEQLYLSSQPLSAEVLSQLISEIDWELRGEGQGNAACTLSVLWLHGEMATALHVGDSAIYRMRHNDISRITQIHGGQGRGLQVYMGMGPNVSELVQVAHEPLRAGDTFFLVTDGVSDYLRPIELARAWARSGGDPGTCARRILSGVSSREGRDDATVVVAQFISDGAQERVTDPTNAPDIPGRLLVTGLGGASSP